MAKSQEDIPPDWDPDPLAAVVLHVLVTEGQQGISTDEVARSCERDPADAAERREIEVALDVLVRDELAIGEDPSFRPTRAAIRATELSF